MYMGPCGDIVAVALVSTSESVSRVASIREAVKEEATFMRLEGSKFRTEYLDGSQSFKIQP